MEARVLGIIKSNCPITPGRVVELVGGSKREVQMYMQILLDKGLISFDKDMNLVG